MTLSYGFSDATDMLGKARRELSALQNAVAAQDEERIGDAIFDISVALSSVRDWLKLHAGRSFTADDVTLYFSSNPALTSFQDMANATKHGAITKYSPTTREVVASIIAPVSYAIATPGASNEPKKDFVVKVVKNDGSRANAVQHAREAIEAWEAFFKQHGVAKSREA